MSALIDPCFREAVESNSNGDDGGDLYEVAQRARRRALATMGVRDELEAQASGRYIAQRLGPVDERRTITWLRRYADEGILPGQGVHKNTSTVVAIILAGYVTTSSSSGRGGATRRLYNLTEWRQKQQHRNTPLPPPQPSPSVSFCSPQCAETHVCGGLPAWFNDPHVVSHLLGTLHHCVFHPPQQTWQPRG